jgi:hypothetical protein
MELRKELVAPEIPEARLAEVKRRILEIDAALEQGRDADGLTAEFTALTGRSYDQFTFQTYWGAISLDQFAKEASRPPPRKVESVTRDELIEIIRRAMLTSGDPDYFYYMEVFDANVPMPKAAMLIYYPPEGSELGRHIGSYDPTPEEIVDQALAWRPIILPRPQAGSAARSAQ